MTCALVASQMLMQTVALLNLAGPDGAKAGLALGTVTSLGLIGLYAKRTLDTGRSTALTLQAHIQLKMPICL